MAADTQPLDRRRSKAGSAGAAADKAEAAVTDLDHQLTTIAGLQEQQQQALRRAEDEAARLKRALKVAAKRHTELVKQRQSAEKRAGVARAKAAAAEAKYDKEVLAEIVRREKERDRASAAAEPESEGRGPKEVAAQPESEGRGPKEVAAGITAAKAAPGRASRRPAAADPAPERGSEASATSRRTAARKTAAR